MSHDPERLLHPRGPGDELERELLASIQHEGPPAHARDEAWLAIAGRIAALGAAAGTAATAASTATAASSSAAAASNATAASAATSATAGATAAAKAGLSAIATKAAWTCAAGTLALGSYLAVQHVRSEPSAPAQTETAVPSAPLGRGGFQTRPPAPTAPRIDPAAQGAAPAAAEPPGSTATATATAAAAPAPAMRRELKPAPLPLDRLSVESALLAAARAQLRAGDARAAEATLARLRARFPRGVLVQEREVLAIELLAARGRGAAAARRASAFVRAYPQSPHSAKLNRFLDAP